VQSTESLVGPVLIAACRYPIDPKVNADGRYECIPIGGSASDAQSAQANQYSPDSGTKIDLHPKPQSQLCEELASRQKLAQSTAEEKRQLTFAHQNSCTDARRMYADADQASTRYFDIVRQHALHCSPEVTRVKIYAQVDANAKQNQDTMAKLYSRCPPTTSVTGKDSADQSSTGTDCGVVLQHVRQLLAACEGDDQADEGNFREIGNCGRDLKHAYCANEAMQAAGSCADARNESSKTCSENEKGANFLCPGAANTTIHLCGVTRRCNRITGAWNPRGWCRLPSSRRAWLREASRALGIRFCPCDDVQISRVPTSIRDQNSADTTARGRDEESAKGQ
jgi:hypothetical protein